MTSIDRTAYPRFKRLITAHELAIPAQRKARREYKNRVNALAADAER
ncbi:hypothetical protein [Streptomyces sp. NPDC003697]